MSFDFSSFKNFSALSLDLSMLTGKMLYLFLGIMVFSFIITIIMIVSDWKIFKKAGKPGWASIVPIYNTIVMFQVAGVSPWCILLLFIPIVNIIILIKTFVNLARSFGKGIGFGVGLMFLSVIFIPMLAFDNSEYIGLNNESDNNKTDDTINNVENVSTNETNQVVDNNKTNESITDNVSTETINEPVIETATTDTTNESVVETNTNPVEPNIFEENTSNNIAEPVVDETISTNEQGELEPSIADSTTTSISEPIISEAPVLPVNDNTTLDSTNIGVTEPNNDNIVASVSEPIKTNNNAKVCKNCGTEMPTIVTICPNCGTENE